MAGLDGAPVSTTHYRWAATLLLLEVTERPETSDEVCEYLPVPDLGVHLARRVDGRDITFDLPVAPWEAARGATVTAPTPEGAVQLSIPAGSSQGRKLRLKGKGLPGKEPGDLYAVLLIALPPSGSQPEKEAYDAMARAFVDFNPRTALEA